MNEIIKAMEERRSIRKFKPEMPTKDDLNQIIEAGLYAANAKGRQATITVAVTNKELRDRLSAVIFFQYLTVNIYHSVNNLNGFSRQAYYSLYELLCPIIPVREYDNIESLGVVKSVAYLVYNKIISVTQCPLHALANYDCPLTYEFDCKQCNKKNYKNIYACTQHLF